MGFTAKRVLRRGSEKGVSRRCLERPLEEYDPLGVRPICGRDEVPKAWMASAQLTSPGTKG